MTTKRTHGPCTCADDRKAMALDAEYHFPDCPSLYPTQQEPDALTRLVRIVRQMQEEQLQRRTDMLAEEALTIISEARDEQTRAAVRAKNEGLEDAAEICEGFGCPCAKDIRHMKDPEP